MTADQRSLSRRSLLKVLGLAGGGLAAGRWPKDGVVMAQDPPRASALETFTGPGANPHWNSVGPYLTEPQKVPLILLTDRPVQLEPPLFPDSIHAQRGVLCAMAPGRNSESR